MRSNLESIHRLAFGLVPDLPGQEDRVAWSLLLEAAAAEELEGLLYHRCRSAGLALPAEVDRRWGEAYRFTAARTLDLLAELERLLAGLASAGLEVLVLPGAALLPLYPDPGCRPMDDLDLLAPPGALAAVVDATVGLGFSRIPRHPALLSRRGLVVDLHDDPLNSGRVSGRELGGRLDPTEVWRARRPRQLEELPVQVLGPEDELLYTAAHALRHSFRRFTWLLDLEGQSRTGVDWDSLRQRARRTGLERALLHGMRVLRDLLGSVGRDLPAPGAAWLEAVPLTRWEGALLRQAWADRPAGSWGDLLWAGGMTSWGHRCRFLAETGFPRPAVMLQVFPRLPAALVPAAYLLRLGQLAWRAVRHLARLLRRL